MTAEKILTSEFFYYFALNYSMPVGEDNLMMFLIDYQEHLAKHVVVNYKGLLFIEDFNEMAPQFNADYAFMLIGDNVKRIYDALKTEYDPLENYFTDRTMETDADNTDTKTGNKDVQKKGQISTTQGGSKERTYTNHGSIGQATSFEEYGDNDFKNVSKDISTGKISDTFASYGSTTTYGSGQTPMSEKTVYDTNDEHVIDESVEEHRKGNSGIFSKQDLTQRELTLRQNNPFVKTFVRMLVDAFNAGVWE